MINRILSSKASFLATKMPVIAILGPRQSGKTTLAKSTFPNHEYFNLEDASIREYAESDPKAFLSNHKRGIILDEVQRLPGLLSYIQVLSDETGETGRFVITGSQNLLLSHHVSQSLAGRVALLKLLPLSLEELELGGWLDGGPDIAMFNGGYPRIYDKEISPCDWYPGYIQTYIERDVRMIKNIDNLALFQKFIRLCAGRTGQLLNLSSLGNECGITHATAKSWIGILEASYIVYLLQPYHKNYNKRLVKTPKLYFYDSGLACALLGIKSAEQIETHYLRGSLFETMIMSELIKYRFNRGIEHGCYFWRDRIGNEIDCIIEQHPTPLSIEIKSGTTVANDYFKGLEQWKKMEKQTENSSFVIYGGTEKQSRSIGQVISWRQCSSIFK